MIVKEKLKQLVLEAEKNIEELTDDQVRQLFVISKKELSRRKGEQ